MNTFQLECFLTVVETLNFAKAAEILNITQPAVTKQIKCLESELNVRLFKRSTRSVELTQEGKLLINDAQTIIQTSLRAKKRFISSQKEFMQYSIGIRLTSHIKLLFKPLNKLLMTYNCFPKFKVDTTSRLLRALYDEQLDIVFDIETQVSGYDSILFKELFKERIYCVCTDKYPVYNYDNVTIEQIRSLDKYPLIFMTAPKTLKEISNAEKAFIGNRPESMVRFCSTAEEVCLLTELGCGIAVIPEMIVPDSLNLRKIPVIDDSAIAFGIYYKNNNSNEITRYFIDILKDFFNE